MSKHDQKPDRRTQRCPSCKRGQCHGCMDITRLKAGLGEPLCTCELKDHAEVVAGNV